jgi:response regulator RpfG family c-di-GMP phosphodiesterase
MSHLPTYNPSSVFMFDKKGNIYFENDSAKKHFSKIKNFNNFSQLEINEIINKEQKIIDYYYNETNHYQLDIVGVQEINSILLYVTDITKVIDLNEEIDSTQRDIIYTMGAIGESRSQETGNHVKRVAKYSYLLAKLYGLSEQESNMLKLASPMHDIGKVSIPDNILNKPDKHTPDEWEIMKTHSNLGYKILKNSNRPIIQTAAIVALEHHEKYDGSGYPNNKKGEDIHIYGRITAIADVFDALGSERVYKKAWELDDILELFKKEKGKHFDPKLIDLFFDNLEQFLKINEKYKDII